MKRSFAIVTIFAAACGGGGGGPSSKTPTQDAPTSTPSAAATPRPNTPAAPSEPSAPSDPPAPSQAPDPSSAPTARQHHGHSHCGWIGADTAEAGAVSFVANADWFDAIHPKWFTLNNDGTVRTLTGADDGQITEAAHEHGVLLMPLIDANSGDMVRAAIANPTAHAQALAQLVAQHGYDGIELDYEHLWNASDRPGFVALITAVAAQLHAAGKQLSLAIPMIATDDGNNAYDYTALQQNADVLHLMGYDFHWLGGPHLGPLAPKGWVSAALTRVESLGAPGKYVLGVANYAIGNGWYTSAGDAVSQCGSDYPRDTDHMKTCSLGNYEAGVAPHCTAPKGDLWFEDAVSFGEKAALAATHHLAGVTYWTLGDEAPGLFDAITAAFP
jgi:chitinase